MANEEYVNCGRLAVCYPAKHQYCDEGLGFCASCEQLCSSARIASNAGLECKNKCAYFLSQFTSPSSSADAVVSDEHEAKSSSSSQIDFLSQFTSSSPRAYAIVSNENEAKSSSSSQFEELLQRQMHLEYLAVAILGVLLLLLVIWLGLACYHHNHNKRARRRNKNEAKVSRCCGNQHVYERLPVVPNNYKQTANNRREIGANSLAASSQNTQPTTPGNNTPALSPANGQSSKQPNQDTDLSGLSSINSLRVDNRDENAAAGIPLLQQHNGNGEYEGVIGHLSDGSSNSAGFPRSTIHNADHETMNELQQSNTSMDTGIGTGSSISQETTIVKQVVYPKANEINEYKVTVM